jgi:SAM-dependent methyltransferase
MKCVLNVGCGNKTTAISPDYKGWKEVRLDIDPKSGADLIWDARELARLDADQYDAIYCSHNLEHFYRHDVPKVLAGFKHVLKPDGYAHIRVPDVGEVMRQFVARRLDIEDMLYESPAGPIAVHDVLYGLGWEIARSGNDFYAHKTGFTVEFLVRTLHVAGFSTVMIGTGELEISSVAFKTAHGHAQWEAERKEAA